MVDDTLLKRLGNAFGGDVTLLPLFRGEQTVRVARSAIRSVCVWLKTEGPFEVLSDLFGVDHYGDPERFEVVYVLQSLATRQTLRLKSRIPEHQPEIESVVPVWQGADWHEREAFDMYGIRFVGHPNLTRILMWTGYPYHPLRKDFPLAGLPADLPATADASAGSVATAPMAGGPFIPGVAVGPGRLGTNGRLSTLSREPRQYDSPAEQLLKLRTPVRKESV